MAAEVKGSLSPDCEAFAPAFDPTACSLGRECGGSLHARMLGEREIEGLVRAADDLYAGAVVRGELGFWLWARPSAKRLTLSPIANPGDRRYGLVITGCFQ